jgi:hypothetical protein
MIVGDPMKCKIISTPMASVTIMNLLRFFNLFAPKRLLICVDFAFAYLMKIISKNT